MQKERDKNTLLALVRMLAVSEPQIMTGTSSSEFMQLHFQSLEVMLISCHLHTCMHL